MSNIIDLNELAPEPRIIRVGNPPKEIQLQPPKLGDLIALSKLGKKLDETGKDSDAAIEVMSEMSDIIYSMVPELKEVHLTTTQIVKIFEILADMAMPEDAKQLNSQGITQDTVKKDQ